MPKKIEATNNGPRLLDYLLRAMGWKNDAALARHLELSPPQVSKIRNGHLGVSGDVKIAVHEKTGMPIADIQALLRADAA